MGLHLAVDVLRLLVAMVVQQLMPVRCVSNLKPNDAQSTLNDTRALHRPSETNNIVARVYIIDAIEQRGACFTLHRKQRRPRGEKWNSLELTICGDCIHAAGINRKNDAAFVDGSTALLLWPHGKSTMI